MTEEATPSEPPPLTLESVQAKFDAWRQRPGTRRPFPDSFWLDVIALQHHYKLSKILTTLKISRAQLASKEQKLTGKTKLAKKTKTPGKEFIEADFSTIHVDTRPDFAELCWPNVLSIELTRPDGTVLKVNELSSQAVDELITRFIV
ncbi:hypothetical protein [Spartinivicinus poritis]|uniref:Transposase n=1 Tax=Spartinivicinus poritis TaxID=2994640 RepID=A0ABT5UHW6_9GAMM|nr:hypothetical protein [Spartinivicinus sp. A2-2]MDE1465985.1 hypothetical protein [Spartinivicinus sp. A2-2]